MVVVVVVVVVAVVAAAAAVVVGVWFARKISEDCCGLVGCVNEGEAVVTDVLGRAVYEISCVRVP